MYAYLLFTNADGLSMCASFVYTQAAYIDALWTSIDSLRYACVTAATDMVTVFIVPLAFSLLDGKTPAQL